MGGQCTAMAAAKAVLQDICTPEVQLAVHAVKVVGERVAVRLRR